MSVHPHAGQLPTSTMLTNIPALMAAYYTDFPSAAVPEERIAFGTSGHRGCALDRTFNEEHIYAVTQAVCDLRKANDIRGPLFLGMDSHALSEAAFRSALEVLVGNGVHVRVTRSGLPTPTPAISHAILTWNRHNPEALADGIVITPSHNPPRDGGYKYNPPHGGPAESAITSRIEKRANELLASDNKDVHLVHLRAARASSFVREHDFIRAYVDDLANVLDMDAIAASGLRLGVDPLGGASLPYWEPIAERYKLNLTVVNTALDPTFSFVPCDHDGKIRMDCSSPYAMNRLLALKNDYDLAFGCDPDADRHGIVTPDGLMNPNHYLTVAADHLFRTRAAWARTAAVGKTLVTSAMIDRAAAALGRKVIEVPVGFKWFVPYLLDGTCGMGCEESAGASFLRQDGLPWSTDKDGPLLCLLAAEILAKRGSPSALYKEMTARFGEALYQRLDAPANAHIRGVLLAITSAQIDIKTLAGSAVTDILTHAPGNGAALGGVKVCSANGWFAIRPSGTENICKIYAESFSGQEHLRAMQDEAQALLQKLLIP